MEARFLVPKLQLGNGDGEHAPSRAGFGALAETNLGRRGKRSSPGEEKSAMTKGVIASTRGACAPQKVGA